MFKFIREYKELRYLAYHDSLTKLYNRNWLYKNIDKIKTNYVYFIDINNLRNVNKKGHTFGDEYIVNCINSITVKDNEFFVRYAGDEFIMFTNTKNKLKTNIFYSVGCCIFDGCMIDSIKKADSEMMKNKNKFKNEH